MVGERGSPSLQHQGGGDLGAQMLGVGADRGQCLGRPKTASRGRGPEKGAALVLLSQKLSQSVAYKGGFGPEPCLLRS
jgi:hypothetical protein